MAFQPIESLFLKSNRVFLGQGPQKKSLPGPALSALSQRVIHYGGKPNKELKELYSPFRGGVLGVMAYDAVRFLEPKLQKEDGNLKRLTPRALDGEFSFYQTYLSMIGDQLTISTGVVVKSNATANVKKLETKLAANLQSTLERIGRAQEFAMKESEITKATLTLLSPAETALPKKTMLGKSAFFTGVKKLKSHIAAGDIFQAVLSEKFTLPFQGDPLDCFKILTALSPAPYAFYLPTQTGAFFGASPEALIRCEKGELESHPIAGTRPRGKNQKQEKLLERQLLRSEKEKAEHLMLVDLARNDLGRVSNAGSVNVHEYMSLKKFGGVMHLVSRVRGKMREDLSAFDALAACFPAGTLSGAPKIRAMQILSEIEPLPRGYYGGAVIAADFSGNLDSCIAIRCIETKGDLAIVQAGAGVVADSRADREYAEIQHKSQMTRAALMISQRKSSGDRR